MYTTWLSRYMEPSTARIVSIPPRTSPYTQFSRMQFLTDLLLVTLMVNTF